MTDKMREEFEAAFARETVRRAIENDLVEAPEEPAEIAACTVFVMGKDRDGDTYHHKHFASAWWAWQASREALAIELPMDIKTMAGPVMYADDVRAAVEAAGLKVKS